MRVGGVVLCGGRSSRMNYPKAMLPFGSESMLGRVVRLLGQAVDPVLVVAAPRQQLPELPPHVSVARDRREGFGPLEGIAAGLAALPQSLEAAYVTSCDVPLLVPAFVRQMTECLGENDVAVPVDGPFHHPLAAVYRLRVQPHLSKLLESGQRRPVTLYDQVPTRRVPVAELRGVDAELATLANLNSPGDYAAALKRFGLCLDPDLARRLNLTSEEVGGNRGGV